MIDNKLELFHNFHHNLVNMLNHAFSMSSRSSSHGGLAGFKATIGPGQACVN